MRQVVMMMIAMVMIIVMMIVMVIMSNYAANGSERKSFGADQSNPERGGRGEKDFHCK